MEKRQRPSAPEGCFRRVKGQRSSTFAPECSPLRNDADTYYCATPSNSSASRSQFRRPACRTLHAAQRPRFRARRGYFTLLRDSSVASRASRRRFRSACPTLATLHSLLFCFHTHIIFQYTVALKRREIDYRARNSRFNYE